MSLYRFIIPFSLLIVLYSRSPAPITQALALRIIVDLAFASHYYHAIFEELGAVNLIRATDQQLLQLRLPHEEFILSSSRKALVCFEQVRLSTIARELYVHLESMIRTNSANTSPSENEKRLILELATLTRQVLLHARVLHCSR